MAAAPERRLCVRGVAASVTAAELAVRFAPFGRVVATEGPHARGVWFVRLAADARALAQCMNVYSNTQWKGMTLRVAEAREPFTARLARERDHQARRAQRHDRRVRLAAAALQHPPPDAVLAKRRGWTTTAQVLDSSKDI